MIPSPGTRRRTIADLKGKKLAWEEGSPSDSDELAASTLHTRGTSWFSGANVEDKPRRILAYVGGLGAYGEHLAAETTQDYPGFALRRVQTVGAAHSDTEEN